MMSPALDDHRNLPSGWWLVPLGFYVALVVILFVAGWIWLT